MIFTRKYLNEVIEISRQIDEDQITKAVDILANLQGRLFILGVGGSAANCSHAVNDFRKIANIEAYAPTDNIAELTARTNDDGWPSVFENWLKVSKLNSQDVLLVLSVGGGSATTSKNLLLAMELAVEKKAKIISVVGRKDGAAGRLSDVCILIPNVSEERVTPHTESFQAIVWHLIVNHPKLKAGRKNKAVFLDRDGTLNALFDQRAPRNLNEFLLFPDALPALNELKQAGFKLIVVTNQPDISRGENTSEAVNAINQELMNKLPVDHVYLCSHSDEDNCLCRKPKTGMYTLAVDKYNLDITKCYMIGDTSRDVDAGYNAGCKKTFQLRDGINLKRIVKEILKDSNGH